MPYPTSSDPFPGRLAALAAMIGMGMPLHVVSLTAAQAKYNTHSGEAAARQLGITVDLRLAARLPARPRGPRHRRSRARPGVERVRPPSARKRQRRHGPQRRAASAPTVERRRRRGGRRSCTAWDQGRPRTGNVKATMTFALLKLGTARTLCSAPGNGCALRSGRKKFRRPVPVAGARRDLRRRPRRNRACGDLAIRRRPTRSCWSSCADGQRGRRWACARRRSSS